GDPVPHLGRGAPAAGAACAAQPDPDRRRPHRDGEEGRMNTPMRRVAMLVMAMVVVLLGGVAYLQVVKAEELRADRRSQRVLVEEYSRQRGQISADGQVLA